MMDKIVFPENIGQPYYKYYFRFILNVLKLQADIVFLNNLDLDFCSFKVIINDKICIFNFSDDPILGVEKYINLGLPIFKCHVDSRHSFAENVIPFTPVSFYNWSKYKEAFKKLEYIPGNIILNNHSIYGLVLKEEHMLEKC